MSGVVNACYDIMGKAFGVPLCKLLGGQYRDRVKAYASTLFRPTPELMQAAVHEYVDRGFRAIKFGYGVFRDDAGQDVELVAAAREAAGPDVELMLDPAWFKPSITVRNTIDLCGRPSRTTSPGSRTASIRRTTRATGSSVGSRPSPSPLASRRPRPGVPPAAQRRPGVRPARPVALRRALGRQTGRGPRGGARDPGRAACLADRPADRNVPPLRRLAEHAAYLEFNVSAGPLARDLFQEPIALQPDGTLLVPTGPGIGGGADPEAIERYRVRDD